MALPQLIANASELARFESAARDAGGRFVEVFLEADDLAERFAARERDQPWLEAVHELVEQAPADHLEQYAARLAALARDAARCGPTGDQDRRPPRLLCRAGGGARLTAR